jgi:eukaryotic-like serine/threonine-protein kinase
MNAERWQRIKSLFERALDHPPSTRDNFLEHLDESPSVVAEVRKLISGDALAGNFLEGIESAESSAPVLSPGELVSGHFRIVNLLGRGGMGVVYRGEDLVLSRQVALKFLPGGLSGTTQALERLKREARAASALSHPNIVTVHEIGEHGGRIFIVMELVDGKPLNELIPRKGMRLAEALRIAAQVADALAAAHAAGIVHRDLKPANIMVDVHGRVRVLDFGLAKLSAPGAAVGVDEATNTLSYEQAVTEEGVIVGSVPYMSPEQAEGKPVDTRSDIFSFGAVLYEMISGQRAFRGESRASTLAAIIERDPQSLSEISSITAPELERLIARCLRKDVNRRSQNMVDVKVALEELRDESESGKPARPTPAPPHARARRWMWPAVAMVSLLIAVAVTWVYYFNFRGAQSKAPDLVRVSPDDGRSYESPTISPDGGFVAYISDRSGKGELWLHQVGGGDPIQLTHSRERVSEPAFFPDGKRILYITTSANNQNSALEIISALGGDPRVLVRGGRMTNEDPKLSPDGREIAYFEYTQGSRRLMTISSDGGQPRELAPWARLPGNLWAGRAAWTSDSRYLLCLVTQATGGAEMEWFALPVEGGDPVTTGAGEALRTAGITGATPSFMVGDRVLFGGGRGQQWNGWEIRFWPGSWRVRGVPHQLTFGTLIEVPNSVSANGTVALQVGDQSKDFYLIPLSAATGQPTGVVRRLTQDGRDKSLMWYLRGAAGSAYFSVRDQTRASLYGLDLNSGKQALMTAMPPSAANLAISPDGRQVAYSIPEGDSYSIRIGDAGAPPADARVLCKTCGSVQGFSADGRFLFYCPEAKVKDDRKRKLTVRLLEVDSGKDKPWLEHSTDSVFAGLPFGQDSGWLSLLLAPPGSPSASRRYLVRWTGEPVAQSEWTKIPWEDGAGTIRWRVSPTGNYFYFFEESKLMAVRFDSQRANFSEPHEVKFAPGSAVTPKPEDLWTVRGPGLVFSREKDIVSVWLMKLPR